MATNYLTTLPGPVATGPASPTPHMAWAIYNPTPPVLAAGQQVPLQCDINGNLLASFSATISGNAAAGPTGQAVPTSADYVGFNSGGLLVGVSSINPLPITGSISATNPSVGTTGAAAPTSATEIGVIDGSGNLRGASSSNPVRIDPTGTTVQPVSSAATTTGGATIYHVVSAGSNNAVQIKGSVGQVYGWSVFNLAGYPIYVKLLNVTGTPDPTSQAVVKTIGVQAGLSVEGSIAAGLPFSTGIGIVIVKDIADNGNTAVVASDCVVEIYYK